MTRQPWTIHPDATVADARRAMREHGVRHLPVLVAGRLVGLVSERDLRLLRDDELTVEDAMSTDVYVAEPGDPVDEVVERMAEHRYGSAVVLERGGRVAGIFTTIDGLQVLADVLRRATA
ncbi:MAG: CBS domain-containing protein [Deltaproteobacteria bacterium]|nr:CBS domain-containing protein [Deltaproteobacteria bacterium]MCW5807897.1 CBS domain-containing protein [Deltaproteobacteria bacterium]